VNVTAKDRATNREQHITISGSSTLNKSEIDRMVRDAEDHAAEDQKLREEAEVKNRGESTLHQLRRQLTDLGDKVQSDQRTDIEARLTTLEEALKGTDTDAIKSATDDASQAFYKVAEEMYRQAEPTPPEGDGYEGADGPHAEAGGHDGSHADHEDVIDAEFRPS